MSGLSFTASILMTIQMKQVGAELCQAQVKLEVVDEVVAEDGCRGCS